MEGPEKDLIALGWFKRAWDDYVDGLPTLLPVLLIQTVLYLPALWLVRRYHSFLPALPYLLFVVTPLSTGTNLVYIKLARGTGAKITDMFSAFRIYPRALAVSVCLGFMTIGGTMLLILPGVLLYLAYCFSEYAVVDRGTGVRGSFALSGAMTNGWKGRLFPVFTLMLVVNVFAPEVVSTAGTLAAPEIRLEPTFWNITSDVLKTLVFLPWLRLVMARAYDFLLAPQPLRAASPDDGERP